jgi:hypothetical protein
MQPTSTLARCFLDDHRRLIKHFSDILNALRGDDVPKAVALARDLDRLAGPHMQFEEAVLYPEVRRHRGEESVARLYEEHRVGLEAVKTLLQCANRGHLDATRKARLESQLGIVLQHAVSCGSLLSYLNALDPEIQRNHLKQLLDFRRAGRLWTDTLPER